MNYGKAQSSKGISQGCLKCYFFYLTFIKKLMMHYSILDLSGEYLLCVIQCFEVHTYLAFSYFIPLKPQNPLCFNMILCGRQYTKCLGLVERKWSVDFTTQLPALIDFKNTFNCIYNCDFQLQLMNRCWHVISTSW